VNISGKRGAEEKVQWLVTQRYSDFFLLPQKCPYVLRYSSFTLSTDVLILFVDN